VGEVVGVEDGEDGEVDRKVNGVGIDDEIPFQMEKLLDIT
jgi:hypothetical protein